MTESASTKAALFDFVRQWTEDARSGRTVPLGDYLLRFPGHEEAIAREFLRIGGATEPSAWVTPPTNVGGESAAALDRLRDPRTTDERYEPGAEIGRGGTGAVLRAHDVELRRDVAMKVLLERTPRQVSRFLDEAQVTGSLSHPGIVPVHDVGVDDSGRVFFTMRLVEGEDLREVIAHVRSGKRGWTTPRALEVLLKVCDTVAYAHARGIVHRDLKPSNVRVGSFGEVYVMDWGLAHVDGRTRPGELAGSGGGEGLPPGSRAHGDSPVLTRDGDVLGTPSYMPPEQARGRAGEISAKSDVYAVGAMLYHLLTGSPPYVQDADSSTSETVLDRVRSGPPASLHPIARDAPAELVSICDKAMSRDPSARYPSLKEMAEDLRAFLEGRAVRAYRTGAWVELAKWTTRNRALASSLVLALALAVGLLATAALLQAKARKRLQLLADAHAAVDLIDRAGKIAPSGPEEVVPLQRWIADATDLVSRRGAYSRELEQLRARALPFDQEKPDERAARRQRDQRIDYMRRVIDFYRRELARVERTGERSNELLPATAIRQKLASFEGHLEEAEGAPLTRTSWTFRDAEDQLRFDTLSALLASTNDFLDSSGSRGRIARMQERLDSARTLPARTLEEASERWAAAIASIRDPGRCPQYSGLVIRPQLGLVPLGRDPESGLWEFLHVQSGTAPALDAGGCRIVDDSAGIVLVLLPGGDFQMGAQRENADLDPFDPDAQPEESATIEGVRSAIPGTLDPFFLSKYELTQAQWLRMSGGNPSSITTCSAPEKVGPGTHPVESVTWADAVLTLRQFGLELPSEARWEYAARGGTRTPWWTGRERDTLRGAANLADCRSEDSRFVPESNRSDWPDLDDGFALHAPVGSYRPNPFGLHDVCGNVSEWCADAGFVSYQRWTDALFGDLERAISPEGLRIRRGGSFATSAERARSAARTIGGPNEANADTGLRPARDLDR